MIDDFIDDLGKKLDRLGKTLGFIYICVLSSIFICFSMWGFYRYGFSSGKMYILEKNISQSCRPSWSRKLTTEDIVDCHKKLKELYEL